MTADTLYWLAGLVFLLAFFALAYFYLLTRRLALEAERRVPMAGKVVEVGGHRLHYVEAGRGAPILFLHGLGGQLHHFRHPLFHRLERDFHLVAVDRPGSGYSVAARGSRGTLKEQAAALAGFIDRLGLECPLVVGHSLGGAVALALALDHPDKVGGLALLSPLTHDEGVVRPEFAPLLVRSPLRRRIIGHTIGIPNSLRHAKETLAFVFGPQPTPQNYVIEGGGLLGLRPSHLIATMTDFVALEGELGRYEGRYQEILCPVGVLFGTADRVLKHEEHALPLGGRIRDFDLELLHGIGHMPQFVAPDETEAFIRRMAAKTFDADDSTAATDGNEAQ